MFTKPTDPTYGNHTFGGWYTDNTFTTEYDFTTLATEDITVYAKWDIDTFTITYDSLGGSSVTSEKVDYNTAFTKPIDPTYGNHTFGGWYTDNTFTTEYDFTTLATEDITVYAKWDIVTFTITYDSLGGSSVTSEKVDYNTAFTKPEDSTYANHTFGGWYTDNTFTTKYDFTTLATKNITVYAKWDIDTFTITYDSLGGSSILSETVDYNTAFTKPTDPTYANNTFRGWYTDNTFTTEYDFTTLATEDITVYAKWDIDTFTITYDSLGGSSATSETVDYNTVFTKPIDPTYENHKFGGCYTDNTFTTEYDFTTLATADITVYAKWSKDEVSVGPTDPEEPLTPDQPLTPDLPVLPEEPVIPEEPVTPEQPVVLDKPGKVEDGPVVNHPSTGISNSSYPIYVLGFSAMILIALVLLKRSKKD